MNYFPVAPGVLAFVVEYLIHIAVETEAKEGEQGGQEQRNEEWSRWMIR